MFLSQIYGTIIGMFPNEVLMCGKLMLSIVRGHRELWCARAEECPPSVVELMDCL
jgi:hypothetical protein